MLAEVSLGATLLAMESEVDSFSNRIAASLALPIAESDARLLFELRRETRKAERLGFGRRGRTHAARRVVLASRPEQTILYEIAKRTITQSAQTIAISHAERIDGLLAATISSVLPVVDYRKLGLDSSPFGSPVLRGESLDRLLTSKLHRFLEVSRSGSEDFTGPVRWSANALRSVARTAFSEAHNATLLALYRERSTWISGFRLVTPRILKGPIEEKAYETIYPLSSESRPPAHIGSRSVISPVFEPGVRIVELEGLMRLGSGRAGTMVAA